MTGSENLRRVNRNIQVSFGLTTSISTFGLLDVCAFFVKVLLCVLMGFSVVAQVVTGSAQHGVSRIQLQRKDVIIFPDPFILSTRSCLNS